MSSGLLDSATGTRNDEGLLIAPLCVVLFRDAKHEQQGVAIVDCLGSLNGLAGPPGVRGHSMALWPGCHSSIHCAGRGCAAERADGRLGYRSLCFGFIDNTVKNFFAGVDGQAPPVGGAKDQASTGSATEEQALSIKGLDPGQAESRECRRQTTASACCGSRHAESAVY